MLCLAIHRTRRLVITFYTLSSLESLKYWICYWSQSVLGQVETVSLFYEASYINGLVFGLSTRVVRTGIVNWKEEGKKPGLLQTAAWSLSRNGEKIGRFVFQGGGSEFKRISTLATEEGRAQRRRGSQLIWTDDDRRRTYSSLLIKMYSYW